ncbi:hypothetical protein IWZ01DRAFT_487123 [Phyllosticta capitalensis]
MHSFSFSEIQAGARVGRTDWIDPELLALDASRKALTTALKTTGVFSTFLGGDFVDIQKPVVEKPARLDVQKPKLDVHGNVAKPGPSGHTVQPTAQDYAVKPIAKPEGKENTASLARHNPGRASKDVRRQHERSHLARSGGAIEPVDMKTPMTTPINAAFETTGVATLAARADPSLFKMVGLEFDEEKAAWESHVRETREIQDRIIEEAVKIFIYYV